jgi:hypothetical protein
MENREGDNQLDKWTPAQARAERIYEARVADSFTKMDLK